MLYLVGTTDWYMEFTLIIVKRSSEEKNGVPRKETNAKFYKQIKNVSCCSIMRIFCLFVWCSVYGLLDSLFFPV